MKNFISYLVVSLSLSSHAVYASNLQRVCSAMSADNKFVVKLSKIDPDDKTLNLTHGYIRACTLSSYLENGSDLCEAYLYSNGINSWNMLDLNGDQYGDLIVQHIDGGPDFGQRSHIILAACGDGTYVPLIEDGFENIKPIRFNKDSNWAELEGLTLTFDPGTGEIIAEEYFSLLFNPRSFQYEKSKKSKSDKLPALTLPFNPNIAWDQFPANLTPKK
jgi:hypothetical protein